MMVVSFWLDYLEGPVSRKSRNVLGEGLFGPEKFSGLSRNGPQVFRLIILSVYIPKLDAIYFFCPFLSSALRNEYFQKGGNDPAILAQMRGLEFEAQTLQANQRLPPPAGIVDRHNCSENCK